MTRAMVGKSQTHVEPVDLIYLLLAVLSLALNALMVYITCRRRRSGWAIDIILLLMIGVSDFLAALVVVLLQLWKFNTSYRAVYIGSSWCHASAVLSQGTLLATICLTALLALVRYLVIVRGNSVSNITWTFVATLILIQCWTVAIANEILSESRLVPSGIFCSSIDSRSTSLNAAFYLVLLLPLIIIPTCYSLLTHHFRKLVHRSRKAYGNEIPRGFRMRFFGLAAMVVVYIFSLFPEYTLHMLVFMFQMELPHWVTDLGRICTFNLTIYNATFALIYHQDINHELLRLVEQYDSRSIELVSPPSKSTATPLKRVPDRTSAFLYFQ